MLQGESDKLAAVDDTLRYLDVDPDTSDQGVQGDVCSSSKWPLSLWSYG